MFDEERKDVLYGQTLLDVLLSFANGLQNGRSGDHVTFLVRLKQIVVVKVVDAVDEALVLRIVLLADRLFEGARLEVQLCGGEAVVSSKFFGVLTFGLLGDEGGVILVTRCPDLHKVHRC